MHRRKGLVTHPYLYCTNCGGKDYIEYSHITKCRGNISEKRQRTWALNQRSVLATKCTGGTHKSFQMHCILMDMPVPVSRSRYSKIGCDVREAIILQAQTSMEQARREVRDLYSIDNGTGEGWKGEGKGWWRSEGWRYKRYCQANSSQGPCAKQTRKD